jgi:hypothetical protein
MEQPKTMPELYEELHQYFLAMLEQEDIDTHILKISKVPNALLLNIEVRPLKVGPQPQAGVRGVRNDYLDMLSQRPEPITPTVSRIPMREPSVLDALRETNGHKDPTEIQRPYKSGLADM